MISPSTAIHVRRKLILTADDYGMCDSVNEAIEECLGAGGLRATCVMVNMPGHLRAAYLRQKFPATSIGIHWNLTQGRPVLPPSQVPNLVKADGSFQPSSVLRRRWLLGRVKLTQIKGELRAQYQRFCEVAGVPDFWNTHQDFHVFPGLFRACVALGHELRIPAMRCHRRLTVPRDTTQSRFHLRHPLFWLKGQVITLWSEQAEAGGVLMPHGKVHTPGYVPGIAAIEEIVNRIIWTGITGPVEMVIHPATTVDEKLFGGLTESRVLEYKAVRDPGLAERLLRNGVETVGFEALARA